MNGSSVSDGYAPRKWELTACAPTLFLLIYCPRSENEGNKTSPYSRQRNRTTCASGPFALTRGPAMRGGGNPDAVQPSRAATLRSSALRARRLSLGVRGSLHEPGY